MKRAVIRSSWMEAYGYRLDCQPYLGGALETKIILERLPLKKEPLNSLTAGHNGGIYNGPKFARTYVDSRRAWRAVRRKQFDALRRPLGPAVAEPKTGRR